jgi:hypothetical protein
LNSDDRKNKFEILGELWQPGAGRVAAKSLEDWGIEGLSVLEIA